MAKWLVKMDARDNLSVDSPASLEWIPAKPGKKNPIHPGDIVEIQCFFGNYIFGVNELEKNSSLKGKNSHLEQIKSLLYKTAVNPHYRLMEIIQDGVQIPFSTFLMSGPDNSPTTPDPLPPEEKSKEMLFQWNLIYNPIDSCDPDWGFAFNFIQSQGKSIPV